MANRVTTLTPGALLGLGALSLVLASCGGGSGGPGPGGAGQGLILVNFLQANQDTIPLNTRLEFRFSEAVDPATVNSASFQIREGPEFGAAIAGSFTTSGDTVLFSPELPTVCAPPNGALKPGTTYRVILMGNPEEFAVRNTSGQPLEQTLTLEFATLPDSDPGYLRDQIPGVLPSVTAAQPLPYTPAVGVEAGDPISFTFSENLDPCSLRLGSTIRVYAYELGDLNTYLDAPNGNKSGFDPVEDAAPGNDYSWGGNGTPLPQPAVIDVVPVFQQTFDLVTLDLLPADGSFPENTLIVVDLTAGIQDFGGSPLNPFTLSFTTENLEGGERTRAIEYDATTPIEVSQTTADVNTARSPSRAQAWLSFGGDGDNGAQPVNYPAWPILDQGSLEITDCSESQPNADEPTVFEPMADITLYTGSEPIEAGTCENPIDGSTSAMWEFESVHIPAGVTVSFVGVNPALFLVQGDFIVDPGGMITVKGGDGNNGVTTPNSSTTPNTSGGVRGGTGTAGGGDGGYSYDPTHNQNYGDPGETDFSAGNFLPGGDTAGKGGVGQKYTSSGYTCPTNFGFPGQGGGGGGHAEDGADGLLLPNLTGSGGAPIAPPDGAGGTSTGDNRLLSPSAGAGGGGGGYGWNTGTAGRARYQNEGGGGGAGGGYFGVVASGSIVVNGTIDASGGKGGISGAGVYTAGGGGGGGAGGAIMLLTSAHIDVTGGTLTAKGGAGGVGYIGVGCQSGGGFQQTWVPHNNGGAGGPGRIVLEDSDSTISGTPTLIQPQTSPGFYLGAFDPMRFGGGISGGSSQAVTKPLGLGGVLRPAALTFEPLEASDFIAGIPGAASLGAMASMVVEMQGYLALPGGGVDLATATGWYVVGYFSDSGSPDAPTWHQDAFPSGFVPDAGTGIGGLDGQAVYVQVRTSFFVPETMDAEDPGPFVDRMQIRYYSNN